ncbi:MAG TPA: prephenate dehydrogenase/arogenate dehydrogenase family protein [Thermoanaerobaculia bacterium]
MRSAPRALIAGLGLIGGSIGMALRARGWRVAFDDPHVTLDEARRAGAADEAGGDADIDLIVIATPVDAAIEILRAASREPRTTSVCGVMLPLREVADERHLTFVAGHPMAGSHEHGLAAASGDLFRNRKWFVDGDEPLVARLIDDCGATMERVEPREHDAAVALTSHLPQLLSTALAAYIGQQDVIDFAGSGLQTFLRLAASDASVWAPIVDANRANIVRHLEGVLRVAREILDGDSDGFTRAQELLRLLTR